MLQITVVVLFKQDRVGLNPSLCQQCYETKTKRRKFWFLPLRSREFAGSHQYPGSFSEHYQKLVVRSHWGFGFSILQLEADGSQLAEEVQSAMEIQHLGSRQAVPGLLGANEI